MGGLKFGRDEILYHDWFKQRPTWAEVKSLSGDEVPPAKSLKDTNIKSSVKIENSVDIELLIAELICFSKIWNY